MGASNTPGVGKIRDFRLKLPFISIGPWLLRDVYRKSQVADRSMSVPMTLSDLERRDARGHIFQADFLNNTRIPFDVERPNSAG